MHALNLQSNSYYSPAQFTFWIHAVWIVSLPIALVLRWIYYSKQFFGRTNIITIPNIPWRITAIYTTALCLILFLGYGWIYDGLCF